MTYREWETNVNELMLKKYGVGIDDIPDQPWFEWFRDDVTVDEAVKWAIEYTNNGEWV